MEGEKFISALGKYYLLGGTGKENKGSLKEIYQRYQHIFEFENIQRLKQEYNENPTKDKKFLLSFLVQGYIGNGIYPLTEEIVKTEMEMSVTINKRPISLRYGMLLLPAEKDRDKRLELDAYLSEQQNELNPLRIKRLEKLKDMASELGFKNYLALVEDTINVDMKNLKVLAQGFLRDTDRVYERLLSKLKSNFLTDDDKPLTKSDITYIFKSNPFDIYFPEIELIPSIEDTFFNMGIDIHDQPNINLSFDRREGKAPKAFCCPINIPDEIHLVLNPKGGIEDYQNSLREAGQSQQYIHTNKDLPFEFKRLGDKSVTEGFSFLFQLLTNNEHWVKRFLNMPEDKLEGYKLFVNGYYLYIIRRFCGKIIYELELYSGSTNENSLRERYQGIMEDAVKVNVNPHNYLLDLDLGFNTPYYIKAWVFESYLRSYLELEYGPEWFREKDSGNLLKELWKMGKSLTCEELLQSLGFKDFTMDILIEHFNKLKV